MLVTNLATSISETSRSDKSGEHSHQQYLQKNPGGYCNIGPNGMSCPVGIAGS